MGVLWRRVGNVTMDSLQVVLLLIKPLFGTPAVVVVVVLGPTDVYFITQCQSGNECMGSDGGLWALVATDWG